MKTLKCSTEHLVCHRIKMNEKICYAIYEKENMEMPKAIYYDPKTNMLLSDYFPKDETKYMYFSEMCEIVQFLYDMEE